MNKRAKYSISFTKRAITTPFLGVFLENKFQNILVKNIRAQCPNSGCSLGLD